MIFDLNPKERLQQANNIEIGVKKKQQIEYLPLGKISIQRGHTLFEIETETHEIRPAQYLVQSATYDLSKAMIIEGLGNLIVNKGCVYIPALNKANALKRFLRSSLQSDYYAKAAPMSISDLRIPKREIGL